MAKPLIHAENNVRKYGGVVEDYLPIHDLMDSSKSVVVDQRHRCLTHNSWFLFILEKIFGSYITNSDGKKISVRQIGEEHILEDFGNKFIPTGQDWLSNLSLKPWMKNAESGMPDSYKSLPIGIQEEDPDLLKQLVERTFQQEAATPIKLKSKESSIKPKVFKPHDIEKSIEFYDDILNREPSFRDILVD